MSLPVSTAERSVALGWGNCGTGGGGGVTAGGGATGAERNSEQPPNNSSPPMQTVSFRIFMGSYLQQSRAVRQLVMRPRRGFKVRRKVARQLIADGVNS